MLCCVMKCLFIHQCSMHLLIRHYSAVSLDTPIGLTLIIAVNQVESIRCWLLGKAWILNWTDIYHIGIVRQYCLPLSYTSCVFVGTSCAHCCIVLIPILIHRWQLPANCTTTNSSSQVWMRREQLHSNVNEVRK